MFFIYYYKKYVIDLFNKYVIDLYNNCSKKDYIIILFFIKSSIKYCNNT